MKLLVEPFGAGRRPGLIAGAIAFVMFAVLAIAAKAQATETIYWDNYGSETIASANIDGTGGGLLNLGGQKVDSPEGMAYDPVTNRLFVANEEGNTVRSSPSTSTEAGPLRSPRPAPRSKNRKAWRSTQRRG